MKPTRVAIYTRDPYTQAPAFLSVMNPSASGASSLVYSTYFGGTPSDAFFGDNGLGVAVDAYGMVYITGWTTSRDFPVTAGAYMTVYPGQPCCGFCGCFAGLGGGLLPSAFMAKFDPLAFGAASVIYSTFLGGSLGTVGYGLAVDSLGNAYVAGSTGAYYGYIAGQVVPFPTTAGAYQSVPDTNDAFVTKFNAAGNNLIYSTLLGGSGGPGQQWATRCALDASNDAYVTGWTDAPNFPPAGNAFLPNDPNPAFQQGFVTQFNSTGTGLLYSSYLGGITGSTNGEFGAIAVDQVGDAYVTGATVAIDFPVTQFPFQPLYAGNVDAFVTKFPIGAPGGISILGITPTTGGNAGQVSPEIVGAGFHFGATAQLNCGGSPVVGQNVTISAGGRILDATFDLTATAPGTCDVVVTNPDQTSAKLAQGFTVQQGGAANLWTTVAGHSLGTGHPPSPFVVTVGNSGKVDALGVVVSIYGIPSDATFAPLFTIAPTPPLPGQPPIDFSGTPFAPVVGQQQIPTLIIPRLPAGSSIELPFNLGVNSLPPPPPLQPTPPPPSNPLPPLPGGSAIDVTSVVTTLDIFLGSGSSNCGRTGAQPGNLDCLGNVLAGLIPELSCLQCLQPILVPQAELLLSIALNQNRMTSYLPENINDWGAEIAMSCLSCVLWKPGGARFWVNWMGAFVSTMMSDCIGTANEGEGQLAVAIDPNDKAGPLAGC